MIFQFAVFKHLLNSLLVNNNFLQQSLKLHKKSEEPYDCDENVGDYNLTLRIDVKFQKVKSTSGMPVQITNDPSATAVFLSEEDFTDKYPWDYDVLSTRLSKRYSDFKMIADYHKIRKRLEKERKLALLQKIKNANI